MNEHICICKKCIYNSKQSLFTVYSSKTTYSIDNPNNKRVGKFIVDDCVLAMLNNELKCDYLFVVNNSGVKDGYFIELKGGDILTAIRQISNSIKHLKENINGVIFASIVCSKFHRAPEIFRNNDYIKLRKLVSGDIKIKARQLSETV